LSTSVDLLIEREPPAFFSVLMYAQMVCIGVRSKSTKSFAILMVGSLRPQEDVVERLASDIRRRRTLDEEEVVLLNLGAGDITNVGPQLLKTLEVRSH
jgi:hypothetical protein